MKLLVATRNRAKQREYRALFEGTGWEVAFPQDLNLASSPEEELLETGATFEANARAKAEFFARKVLLPTVADDSGLEVFSLGGDPGVRSRRWAGASGTDLEVDLANNAYLLRRLLGAAPERRRARYRCAVAYLSTPRGFAQVFEGSCTGQILTEPHGNHGFGYDPLFLSDDLGKSFGEATTDEKDSVSHRGRAFAALRQALTEPE